MYRSIIIGDSFSKTLMLKEKIMAMNTDLQRPEINKSTTQGDKLALLSGYDIAFIYLDGENAFGLLQQLPAERNFEVIFISEKFQLDYAIKALKLSVADYITTPIKDTDLEKAINKSIEIIKLKRHKKLPFYNNTKSLPPPTHKIYKNSSIAFEKRTGEIEIIQLDEIVYFSTGNSHECEVKLIDSTNITLNKALSHYRKTFIEEGNFFPINRSIILNLSYINTFNPQKQIIRLTTGEELSISRRQASKLRQLLLRTEEDNDQHIG
ncbi:hypothetical protein IX339_000298 [Porphyromonas levii]|uniref:LytR/AlgR family response regulator transcription factor n=1 Tax=Porphyromonas levii TaxID=28114 RepID=UPI001B8CEE1C|nr:LytTR family DNA-binding domain-containing protein [Porphyromonas levii]MBR8730865.1 hypothetical protein [Porphyromonas levii]